LQRFWYLRRLVLGALAISLLFSAILAVVLAWRSAQNGIETSARRAVLNAERMIDRTSADLQKLDVLTARPCDEATVGKLKDAVYASPSQMREIGLIQNKILYCTNFGPVNLDISPVRDALKMGTFITAGPNMVVANNASLFVYATLQEGRTVNAVLNPTLMAEFERASALSGRAHLSMRYSGPAASGIRVERSEQLYEIGKPDVKINSGTTMIGSYTSSRFPLFAEVHADRAIFWDEYWPTVGHLLGLILPMFLVGAFAFDRLLASGALSRVRYRQALKRGQLRVFYQPIVSAQTRRLVGMEALLRWEHPKQGLLRAAQFPELFNDPVMDEPIARFVLDTVAADLKSAPRIASHVWCSVNIAPSLLEIPSFVTEMILYAEGLSQNQLRIEVTERTPVTPRAELSIREIRGHGIRVGMDDFGTGYSNINQLQTLAYDFIKVDGLLIRGIHSVDGLSPVLESIIELAARLETEVVAEGVETIVQAQALSKRNVKSLQGYLFSQAKPFAEVLSTVEDEHALNLTMSI
jgi:sensor c-di-GMP phosphodiesterase-like protein